MDKGLIARQRDKQTGRQTDTFQSLMNDVFLGKDGQIGLYLDQSYCSSSPEVGGGWLCVNQK